MLNKLPIRTIRDVYINLDKTNKKKVALAQAADPEVLNAVSEAYKEGIIEAILVGNKQKIEGIAAENHIDITPFEIMNIEKEAEIPLEAVKLVSSKKADVLMKGLLESKDFLRAVLDPEVGIRKQGSVITGNALVELKKVNRLVIISDLAFVTYPDKEMKVEIIKNAVEIAHKLGIECPKVAMLCATESVNPKMQSTIDAKEIVEMNKRGEIKNCIIAGPISFDLAMSEEAARHKGYSNEVAGNADIILVPTIEVGNAVYKALSYFADVESAGIMMGSNAPIIFCSRADTVETKKNTIALAVYMAD